MNLSQKLPLVLLPVVLLAGCGTFDDPMDYQPSASSTDTGRVCLYRMAPRKTPGAWQDFIVDGSWEGQIRPDKYYCDDIHVGRHIVRVGVGKEHLEFMLEKDQEVFIRFEVDDKGIYPILMDPQIAREEFELRESDNKRRDATP